MTGQEEDRALYTDPTMEEIYSRQRGKCWLEIEFDDINGNQVYGDLYCTDGDIKAPTATLINPSAECMKCISKFVASLFE